MGQVLHGCARTTEAVRLVIQGRGESVRTLAARYGVSPTTIQKWRKRDHVHDAAMGPKEVRSSTLTLEQEAAVVAFRRHTLLPLDDCLYTLQPSLPHLTRSSLHRCLQRHGISRLPEIGGDRPGKRKFKVYPIERMNRTIKDATVKRYHYADHQQLMARLELFVAAYNHARRLKTLNASTPHQYVCQIWTEEPERPKTNPYHHTPGLNN